MQTLASYKQIDIYFLSFGQLSSNNSHTKNVNAFLFILQTLRFGIDLLTQFSSMYFYGDTSLSSRITFTLFFYLPFNKKFELYDILIVCYLDYIYLLIRHFHVYHFASLGCLFLIARGHLCNSPHHDNASLHPGQTNLIITYSLWEFQPKLQHIHISLGFCLFFFNQYFKQSANFSSLTLCQGKAIVFRTLIYNSQLDQ